MLPPDDLVLYTDLYQLTMAQGYLLTGRQHDRAIFDYYYRELPFDGGYVVFAGISDALEMLASLRFAPAHLDYLRAQGFGQPFLDYLSKWRFAGSIMGLREGELAMPNAPILRVQGNMIEAQMVETLLLNVLNYSSLIATKAARMRQVAGTRTLIDMGLRRAQGFGGLQGSKAAMIGGFDATSNVLVGYQTGIAVVGTQAHAWIQSYGDELAAFRAFAELYPTNTTLLVDTYDTLASGVPNAIMVAKEMESRGHRMRGIRLDSGDLAYLTQRARTMLDDAGLQYVKIVVSNQLDEYLIKSLLEQQAPIDVFGVGTKLIVADGSPALGGVYKLVEVNDQPRIKISENVVKVTLPGRKQVLRYSDRAGMFRGDGIVLDGQATEPFMYHPHYPDQRTRTVDYAAEPLLHPLMQQGELVGELSTPAQSAAYAQARLAQLPAEHKRFENPHFYKVGISQAVQQLRSQLIAAARKD